MQFDVITIGTATKDIFVSSPLFKIIKNEEHLKKLGFVAGEATCFALGAKIEIEKPILTFGGGAANSSITFAKQNLKSATVIKIGDDETGREITAKLKKEKITPFFSLDNKLSTAYSIILLSPTGERTILVYRGAAQKMGLQDIPFNKLKAKWAYISPGKINFKVFKKIISSFYDKKILVALNPSKDIIKAGIKKLLPIFGKVRVLIMNREESAYLTGIDYGKKEEIFKKVDDAVEGIFVMTDGRNGAWISDNQKIYQVGNYKAKVVDETGAGDAFGSGFVAGIIHKKEACRKGVCNLNNIQYAIRLASANAASVVEHIGAQKGILSLEEFENNKRWKELPIKIVKNGN
ncbi:MAG: carbohydrate kinase family protein [Patescibacteria group bacterium]|nr:carbohydrate kinase family protein [Patescibacteria group bacterium]